MLLVPRHEGDYANVGTVAEVVEIGRLPGGAPRRRRSTGLHRARCSARPRPAPTAGCASRSRSGPTRRRRRSRRASSRREYRAVVEEILELRDADRRIGEFLRSITEPGALADTCALRARPDASSSASSCSRRSTSSSGSSSRSRCSASGSPSCRCASRIREDVESGAQKQQREYFLRKQMESIRKELGEDDGSVVDEYRTKIEEAGMPDDGARAGRARARPARAHGRRSSGESSMIRTLPRLAARRAVGQDAPRSGSTRRTRARSSTPTTPASRTSRSGSSSTSPCASCARSAGSRRTSAPARSSP